MVSEAHLKSIVSEHKFLVYLEFTVQTSLCREKKCINKIILSGSKLV